MAPKKKTRGGPRKGAGRPEKALAKTELIGVRLTARRKAELESALATRGWAVADAVRCLDSLIELVDLVADGRAEQAVARAQFLRGLRDFAAHG